MRQRSPETPSPVQVRSEGGETSGADPAASTSEQRSAIDEVCVEHPIHPRLGSGPAKCLADVISVSHEMEAGLGALLVGRRGSSVLRDLDLGMLPAKSMPRLDLSGLEAGCGTELKVAVLSGVERGKRILLPRAVRDGADLNCDVQARADVLWEEVDVRGRVTLTVGKGSRCTLRSWKVQEGAALKIVAHEGARIDLESCDVAGSIELLDTELVNTTIRFSRAPRGDGIGAVGAFKLREKLNLVNSTVDLEQSPWAPVLKEEVALRLREGAKAVLPLGAEGSVSLTLDSNSDASLWAHESLNIRSVKSTQGVERVGPVAELACAVGGQWVDGSGAPTPILDAGAVAIEEFADAGVDVGVEFAKVAKGQLAVNSAGQGILKRPIVVSSDSLVTAEVLVEAGNPEDVAMVLPSPHPDKQPNLRFI